MTTRSNACHRTPASSHRAAVATAPRRESSSNSNRSSSVSVGTSRDVASAIFTCLVFLRDATSTTGRWARGTRRGRRGAGRRETRGRGRVPSPGTLHLVLRVSGLDPGGPHLPILGSRLEPNHRAFLGGRALDLRVGVPINRPLLALVALDHHHLLIVVHLADRSAHRLVAHLGVVRQGHRGQRDSKHECQREKPFHRSSSNRFWELPDCSSHIRYATIRKRDWKRFLFLYSLSRAR